MATKLFNERPRWQQYLLIIVTFTIAFSLVSCVENIKQRYEEAMPGTRMEYLNLYFYASLKKKVVGLGVSPESGFVKWLDEWGEESYKKGLKRMPEKLSERYVWFYIRYIYPYPQGFALESLPEYEEIAYKSIVELNQYINATSYNTTLTAANLPYDAASRMLAAYVRSSSFLQNKSNQNTLFVESFYYSIKQLLTNQTSLNDIHTRYYMIGRLVTEVAVSYLSDFQCDNRVVRQYLYIRDKYTSEPLLKRASRGAFQDYQEFVAAIPLSISESNNRIVAKCSNNEGIL